MTFAELERLLRKHGFKPVRKLKGSGTFWLNLETGRSTKVDFHGKKEVPPGTLNAILKQAGIKGKK